MFLADRLLDELRGMAHWLLPPTCPACEATRDPDRPLCDVCLKRLSTLPAGRCPRCSLPYPGQNSSHLCGDCIKNPPPFSSVLAIGCYEGLLRELVQRLKYQRLPILDSAFGQLLAEQYLSAAQNKNIDHIIPVPLHPSRLKQRTFNQALLIARAMARQTGHRVEPQLLQRVRTTELQQKLSATERQGNLRKAFMVKAPVNGARLLLIDDVMTTGATARACASALLEAGAADVRVAVLARAARHLPSR